MKLSIRLAALAITAAAFAGALGAQARSSGHSGGRSAASRGPARSASMAFRGPVRSAPMASRQEVRGPRYAPARAEVRAPVRASVRAPVRAGYGPNIAEHGRPLITRAGAFRDVRYGGGFRYWRGVDRFGVRIALPFGWERPLFVRGYFPAAYLGYCEAVPVDLDYMLPPMYDGYDSCLIGDRIVVYNGFTRGISFVAVIP